MVDQSVEPQNNKWQHNEAQLQITEIEDKDQLDYYTLIITGTISDDLKYMVTGGWSRRLNIWDYQSSNLIKSVNIHEEIFSCKFSENSKFLFVLTYNKLRKFRTNHMFKQSLVLIVTKNFQQRMCCLSNHMLISATREAKLMKSYKNKLLVRIKVPDHITGMDYNKRNNMLLSAEKQIKLWNLNDNSVFLKQECSSKILKLLFIVDRQQFISSNQCCQMIIWNINYTEKYMEQVFVIDETIRNISFVENQQYIKIVCVEFIRIYTLQGKLIKQFAIDLYPEGVEQELYPIYMIQPNQIEASIAQRNCKYKYNILDKLFLCRLKID